MTAPRKNETNRRGGRPFTKGNGGRPKGARNKTTVAAEALLAGEGEALTRKCIELALEGDTVALKLCLDRLVPPAKTRRITLTLPMVKTAGDVLEAQAAVVQAMAAGEIAPDEATAITGLLEQQRRAIESVDHEQRLRALEAGHAVPSDIEEQPR